MKKSLGKIICACIFALIGYAILNMRFFHPYHRAVSLSVYAVSAALLLWAARDQWKRSAAKRVVLLKRFYSYLPQIVVAVVIILLARAAWVLVPVQDTVLTTMADDELRENITDDLKRLAVVRENSRRLYDSMEAELLGRDMSQMGLEERDRVRGLWGDFLVNLFEYDLLKDKYCGFYQIEYMVKPGLHADAFFLAFASLLSEYDWVLRTTTLVGSGSLLDAILNEGSDRYPENSLLAVKQKITDPDVLLQLSAGTAYLQFVKKDMSVAGSEIEQLEAELKLTVSSLSKEPGLFVKNPLDLLERASFGPWYPMQKSVAKQLSMIRTAKRDYFIPSTAAESFGKGFSPGDILLERRNWHLSNIGIPGFWPHAALYIGTPEQMDEAFEGLGVLDDEPASEYLRRNFPGVWQSLAVPDADGYRKNVMEALKDGVVLTSIEHSGHCDYLAVLRPAVSKEDKFKAITKAFGYWGRPYDYNFDFATDNALVCSELVYKAYEDSNSLDLKPEMINGRLVLPPNLIVRKFDELLGKEGQKLAFVLYLEGSEDRQSFFKRDAETFRKTWRYPKWDISQK